MGLLSFIRTLRDYVFRRSRIEREMDEEFRSHIKLRAVELERRGLSRTEAERRARIEFGSYQKYKDECREALGTRLLQELIQDFRYGLRQLRRNPGFTAVAVLTLALGIGATTAIFSVLYTALLSPWPYQANIDRFAVLVKHDSIHPQTGYLWAFIPSAEFMVYQQQNHVFDQVIGTRGESVLVTGREIATDWFSIRVTSNTFRVLGVAPIMGRTITPDDAKPGAPPVVVLSYKGWQSRLGGDPNILGKTLILNHEPTTVIGVMPKRFLWGTNVVDCWLPASRLTICNWWGT